MTRHIALLRGINVGGHGIISMDALRALFTAAGAGDVSTYINSGNVIFSATARALPAIQRKVHTQLVRRLGEKAATIYRTSEEIHTIFAHDPFGHLSADAKSYVLFLAGAPAARPNIPFRSEKEACEVIGMRGLDLFIASFPKKNGRHGFPNNWVEKDLGVVSTARNWNTVSKLADLTR